MKKLIFCLTAAAALLAAACKHSDGDGKSNIPVTGIEVAPSAVTLEAGATQTLTATVTPENATNREVAWKSYNPEVADVTVANGTATVQAKTSGTAIISVSTISGNCPAICTVTVTAPAKDVPATGVTLNKNTLALVVGAKETLEATVAPDNATDKSVTWSSSNAAAATVDSATGEVAAVAAGSAIITVATTAAGHTATCTVTVSAPSPTQPAPLTIYSAENYGGTPAPLDLYTFYGAADATLLPAAPVPANVLSFKLEKGYMVCMAENADGTGYSRVWGAFDQNLDVPSLPAALAGKVVFIRVLPWENTNKKGVGRATASVYNTNYMTMADLQWYYNWGRTANSGVNVPFVPMAWGRDAVNNLSNYNQIVNVREICQLLAFNEPDGTNTSTSANMPVDEAITLYPKLLATGMRMGSPAPVATGWNNWLKNFMKQAQAKKYRVDFICLHWYDADDWNANKNLDFTDAQADACVSRLKTYLQNVYAMYGLPIWLTEFNCNKNRSMSAQVKFYPRAVAMMETLDYVERHAYMIPNVVAPNPYSNGDFLLPSTPLTLSEMGVAFKNVETSRAIKTPCYESSGNLDKQYNF